MAFQLSYFLMARSDQRNREIAQELSKKVEEQIETIKEEVVEEEEEKEEGPTKEQQEAIDNYKRQAGALLSKMQELNRRLTGIRIEADSDAEYEELMNRASFYLGEIRRYKAKVKRLSAPEGMKNVHESVVKAVDAQLYACSKLRRYYNAENSDEEEAAARIFRGKNRQASSLLSEASAGLK
jgi:hypothetical protein